MTTASRSNILVRAARRIAAVTAEMNYAQHRLGEIMTNLPGK
jgi:hypothetical protein